MSSVSKVQHSLMNIVRNIQTGKAKASDFSKTAQDMAKNMDPEDVEDFASTSPKGLPTRVKKEAVDREDINFLILQLINSMRHYNEREFIIGMSAAGGYDPRILKKIYSHYHKLPIVLKTTWKANQWKKWLNRYGIKESTSFVMKESNVVVKKIRLGISVADKHLQPYFLKIISNLKLGDTFSMPLNCCFLYIYKEEVYLYITDIGIRRMHLLLRHYGKDYIRKMIISYRKAVLNKFNNEN